MFVVFFTIYYSVAIFECMPACCSLVHHRCQIYEVHCFSIALVHAIFWLVQIYMPYTCMACTTANCTHTSKVGKLERDLPTHMTTRHVYVVTSLQLNSADMLQCISIFSFTQPHMYTCNKHFLFPLRFGFRGYW